MITGKYDRQPDRSNSSKNVRDLALGIYLTLVGHLSYAIMDKIQYD
ncbi:hypothetical protein VA7868_02639 [Vibrio aerogenes CECT 7868]|uniref:Uncharacterized protein n=1 Tax=Vibrio aerogenes CECT 7868 TaxID=1216006 RepID=A0A1M5ZEM9_9VIBR|nr:hypothetical protein VA7868_02639 [Vibrio aerogenes CECT 7868]